MNAWDDPRIARGMEKQLGTRRARIAAPATHAKLAAEPARQSRPAGPLRP